MGKFQLPEQFWTSKNDQNDDTKGLFGSTGPNGIQWVEFPYQIHSETTSRVTSVSTSLGTWSKSCNKSCGPNSWGVKRSQLFRGKLQKCI